MDITEEFGLYDQHFNVDNPKVDAYHMLLYKFPDTLKEPGIYNFLEHIKCIPVNITLLKNCREEAPYCDLPMPRDIGNICAIIEFANKVTLQRAFYQINKNYSKFMKAQYTFINLNDSMENSVQVKQFSELYNATPTTSNLTLLTLNETRGTIKLEVGQCLHNVYCFMDKSQVRPSQDQRSEELQLQRLCMICASGLNCCIEHQHYFI